MACLSAMQEKWGVTGRWVKLKGIKNGTSEQPQKKRSMQLFFPRVIFEVSIKKLDKSCLYLRDRYCHKTTGISKNMVIQSRD